MKHWLCALAMCQSMFCAIPFPWNLWNEEARDKMLLWLPVIGLEMGLIWWGLGALCRFLALTRLLTALVLAVYPFLVSGFLHLDGFLDVTDAVRSCRSLERRREILKDSHVGAFAVIGCCILMLTQFAAAASWADTLPLGILALVPVVSRVCSAFAVTALPPMATSEYAKRKRSAARLCVLGTMGAATLTMGFLLFGKYGVALAGQTAIHALAVLRGFRSLKGMNGDISGYALTMSEVGAAVLLALL